MARIRQKVTRYRKEATLFGCSRLIVVNRAVAISIGASHLFP